MSLHTPQSAVLAVIFNALIIIALVPLALRGGKYRPLDAASLCGGIYLFTASAAHRAVSRIWIIDQLLVALRLA